MSFLGNALHDPYILQENGINISLSQGGTRVNKQDYDLGLKGVALSNNLRLNVRTETFSFSIAAWIRENIKQ